MAARIWELECKADQFAEHIDMATTGLGLLPVGAISVMSIPAVTWLTATCDVVAAALGSDLKCTVYGGGCI